MSSSPCHHHHVIITMSSLPASLFSDILSVPSHLKGLSDTTTHPTEFPHRMEKSRTKQWTSAV
eukprot:1091715-Amphidinium_carterae.1